MRFLLRNRVVVRPSNDSLLLNGRSWWLRRAESSRLRHLTNFYPRLKLSGFTAGSHTKQINHRAESVVRLRSGRTVPKNTYVFSWRTPPSYAAPLLYVKIYTKPYYETRLMSHYRFRINNFGTRAALVFCLKARSQYFLHSTLVPICVRCI